MAQVHACMRVVRLRMVRMRAYIRVHMARVRVRTSACEHECMRELARLVVSELQKVLHAAPATLAGLFLLWSSEVRGLFAPDSRTR